ncbi:hypothetical protein T265_01424 [Opisthorchis viverrini]|uniref:Uncharacterized protein n=1 Tax=Opisthorchis viverrini TaxID=6198 RepID=A0A075AJ06_OPIVI|nr:hypothetical protein T265_01424 [Opisthorchis viverrini]KER32549.1 hypothetical protein T265_01424 [Opisthorchis viverrini]
MNIHSGNQYFAPAIRLRWVDQLSNHPSTRSPQMGGKRLQTDCQTQQTGQPPLDQQQKLEVELGFVTLLVARRFVHPLPAAGSYGNGSGLEYGRHLHILSRSNESHLSTTSATDGGVINLNQIIEGNHVVGQLRARGDSSVVPAMEEERKGGARVRSYEERASRYIRVSNALQKLKLKSTPVK